MQGVNEIRSNEEIPADIIVALCEGLLCKIEEPEMKRKRQTDPDLYYRSLKTQFKRLDDRYPGIFNMLVEYGRKTPQGHDIMTRIKQMIGFRDRIQSGEDREQFDKTIDYKYAHEFVRPAIGADRFDTIVKSPEEQQQPPN